MHYARSRSAATALGEAAASIFGLLKRTAEAGSREILIVAAQDEFVSPTQRFPVEAFEPPCAFASAPSTSRTSPRATALGRASGPRPRRRCRCSTSRGRDPRAGRASIAVALEDDKRELTALAIAETRADILALQEVDNLSVLKAFFANYVHRVSDIRYGHFKLVHGNDQRGIDVAFAARKSLVDAAEVVVTSHHEATLPSSAATTSPEALGIQPDDRVFNRDCLEVELDFGEARLTLFSAISRP